MMFSPEQEYELIQYRIKEMRREAQYLRQLREAKRYRQERQAAQGYTPAWKRLPAEFAGRLLEKVGRRLVQGGDWLRTRYTEPNRGWKESAG
jgi:hypothetical protein